MKLIGRTGAVAGQDAPVGASLRIGAAADNDLRVEVTGISRHHARIVRLGDDYWLEDSGSTNGTFVNGLRVARERLRHLDVVTLGRGVDLIAVASEQISPSTTMHAVKAAWLEPMDAQSGARIDIPPGELTLGRSAPSNVLLDSPLVSHMHAKLERTPDHLIVSDLASSNGTFVNGLLAREPVELVDGDLLSIAGSRQFRVCIEGVVRRDGAPKADTSRGPVFNEEWKTRLVWSADELVELEADRQRVLAAWKKEQALAAAQPGAAPKAAAAAPKAAPPVPPAPKAAPAVAPHAAAPPAAKPAPKPAPAPKPPQAAAPKPAAPPAPAPAAKPDRPAPPAAPEGAAAPAAPTPKGPTDRVSAAPRPQPSPRAGAPEPPKVASAPSVQPAARAPKPPPAHAPSKSIRSVVLKGAEKSFRLGPGRHDVGRTEGISVTLLSPQVSRHHASIIVTPTEVRVEDAKSANGTVINGARVPIGGTAPITTGDRLAFGNMEFIVELVS